MIGFGFEAFVFAYLGISFFSYVDTEYMLYPWSWSFILVELFICIAARFTGTVGLLYLTKLLGHKPLVSFKQVLFICYAGLIRGAIAFGLVLKLDSSIVPNDDTRNVITTTALTLVISTTLMFGSTMPLVQRYLVPPLDSDKHEYDEAATENLDSDGEKEEGDDKNDSKHAKINNSNDKKIPRHSEHEEFLHPNALKDS